MMRVKVFARFALIVRVLCLAQQDYYYYSEYSDDDVDKAYKDHLTSHVPKDWDIGQDYEVCIFMLLLSVFPGVLFNSL